MTPLPRSPRSRRLLAAAAAGAALALAGPPTDAIALLWGGMAVLAALLETSDRASHGIGPRWIPGADVGLAFGTGANVVAFRFVPQVITRFTPLPWIVGLVALVLLAAAQGLVWAAAAVVRGHLARRGVPGWLAFAAGVYAGTFVPMVFPWTPGAGASSWPVFVQLAEVCGERGVTFLMAATAALLATAARRAVARERAWRAPTVAAAAILGVSLAFGAWRMHDVERARAAAPTARVALVQPSIEATERWDPARAAAILEKLEALTRSAEAKGVDLTVWPEAAYPYEIGHASHRAPIGTWALLGPGVHGPLLVGTLTRGPDEEGGACNSAVVVERDGTLSQPYDKMHLLWFGEEVPFAEEIPWLRRTFARGGGLRPGHEEVPLPAGPVRAAVLNCFEDTLPAAGREAASVEPNLLVNVTNDAWFAGSWESELHLRMAVMRSVELRRDMVRAVNGGRTSFVDATGRVRSRWESDLPGTLLAEPALLTSPTTLFARYGDAPWLLALSAFLVVLLRRQNAKGAGSSDPTPPTETS